MKRFYKINNCIELVLSQYINQNRNIQYGHIIDDTTCSYLNYFSVNQSMLNIGTIFHHIEYEPFHVALSDVTAYPEHLKFFGLDKFTNLKEVVYDVSYDTKYFHNTSSITMLTLNNIKGNLNLQDFKNNNLKILCLNAEETNNLSVNIEEIVSLFKNLEQLSITNATVDNLSSIKDLKFLKSLEIRNSRLSAFPKFTTSLHSLVIDNCNGFDLSQIALKNLKKLTIHHQNLTDIFFVSKYKNLMELDISFNYIKDISPIFHLNKLNLLIASNNCITSIPDNSKDMVHLTLLDLSNNLIKSALPLTEIPLDYLYLKHNPITDLQDTLYREYKNNPNCIRMLDIAELFHCSPNKIKT